MAYHSSVGCDLGGDPPTGYATHSACFHTPEITITLTLGTRAVLKPQRDEKAVTSKKKGG